MNNNYEYIKVDPKVIAAFGGDASDDSFLNELDLNEDLDKPPKQYKTKSINEQASLSSNSFISSIMENEPVDVKNQEKNDIYSALMQIATELNQIKTILAGK